MRNALAALILALGAAGCSSVERGTADSPNPDWESPKTRLRSEPSPDWLRLEPARETTGDNANPLNRSADGRPESR
jgi:hypothetical protein